MTMGAERRTHIVGVLLKKKVTMQTSSVTPEIVNAIQDFFDAESRRCRPGLCERCGSSMQFLDAQFQLYGTPMAWKAQLSFCPACESDVSRSVLRLGITESK